MANYFEDNEDLKFYVEKDIDWSSLVSVTERDLGSDEGFKNVEEATTFYKEILNLVGEFSADEIAKRAKAIDQKGLTFKDGDVVFSKPLKEVFEKITDLQLHGMCLPRELGGMNAPLMVYMINGELMGRGDVSVMAHHSFHGGIAMALLIFSIWEGSTEVTDDDSPKIVKTRFQKAINEITSGQAWGSMDITEPDAGSDMAQLRAKAEKDDDGQWHVTGQKIFITSGHGKYHIVIARTEESDPNDPFAGLSGLSLFLVEAFEEVDGKKVWNATFNGIEDKIGHHGSATVAVNYDRAKAELIGKRGDGFKLMLLLMNNARVGVGFESLGLCEAAYRMAKSYASERPSMGKTIDRHEMIADYLEEMATDIQAIRALSVNGCFHEEMAQKIDVELTLGKPSAEKREELEKSLSYHKSQSRALTPLLKYLGAEKAVEISRRNIQIHGGVGYTKEYDAERLLRDALVFPIYEGTSQIQALMATKDVLIKSMKEAGKFAQKAAWAKTQAVTGRTLLRRRVAQIQTLTNGAIRHLLTRIALEKAKDVRAKPLTEWSQAFLKDWNPKTDFAPALLHAERLTQLLIDQTVCEIFLKQAEKYPEREDVLVRYLDRAEPRAHYLHRQITSTGKRILGHLKDLPVGRSESAQSSVHP